MARRYRPHREPDLGPIWWAGSLGGLIVGALILGLFALEHWLAWAFIGFLVALIGGLASKKHLARRMIRSLRLRTTRGR